MGAVDQVIALAYLRQTLQRHQEAWRDQRSVYRRTEQAWARERYADGVIEGLAIALFHVDMSLDVIERAKEVTKHNGS